MSVKKEQAIQEVLKQVEDFSGLIMKQLDLLEAVMSSDEIRFSPEQFAELKKNEKIFDQFEIEISDRIINTMVLYQPMATDLRKLISCYRITINLERIGDLILNIVNFIQKMQDPSIINQLSGVVYNMLISSINMVRKSVLSFTNSDRDFALWTIKNDAVVDEMNHKLLKQSLMKSEINKETRNLMLNFIQFNNIISNIERIADHATNIAESAIYSLDGTDLRHQKLPNEKAKNK